MNVLRNSTKVFKFQPSFQRVRHLGYFQKAKFNSTQPPFSQLFGWLVVGGGLTLTCSLFPSNSISNQAQQTHIVDSQISIKEPITSVDQPEALNVNEKSYQLVGYGVRTVTFLNFTAYTISIYLDLEKVKTGKVFDKFDGEKFLNDVNYSNSVLEKLLENQVEFVIRIVPVKSTTGTHIKGGLTRALNLQLNHQTQLNPSPIDSNRQLEIKRCLLDFQQMFPTTSLPIYKPLHLVKDKNGNTLLYNETGLLGKVEDSWPIDNLLVTYLNGYRIVTEDVRKSFATRFSQLIS